MLITPQSLTDVFIAYKTSFNVGFEGAPST